MSLMSSRYEVSAASAALQGGTRFAEIGAGNIRCRVVGEGIGLAFGPRRIDFVNLLNQPCPAGLALRAAGDSSMTTEAGVLLFRSAVLLTPRERLE